MALPFAFGETLSPSAKRPPLLPGQLIQCGGVRLLEFFKRGRRLVQHTVQFRCLLLGFGCTSFSLVGTLLKTHRLLVGGHQELLALRDVVRQRVGSIHVTHDYNNLFRWRKTKLGNKDRKAKSFSTDVTVAPSPASRPQIESAEQPDQL
jgi:hypothetical protein